MLKLCIFVGSAVVSGIFGWVADAHGCDLFWSFLIASVGAIVGVWAGWAVHRRFFG
jgi:hypothetical protein